MTAPVLVVRGKLDVQVPRWRQARLKSKKSIEAIDDKSVVRLDPAAICLNSATNLEVEGGLGEHTKRLTKARGGSNGEGSLPWEFMIPFSLQWVYPS